MAPTTPSRMARPTGTRTSDPTSVDGRRDVRHLVVQDLVETCQGMDSDDHTGREIR